jgi:lactoylglutathione lyase
MNFCWITLNVNNMEESLKFYHEIIGLEVLERFTLGEKTEIVMLGKTDGTKVELIYNKNKNVSIQSHNISIGFEVKSLDEAMELVKKQNILIKRGPISPMSSIRFFIIDDPNGIAIQIVENH